MPAHPVPAPAIVSDELSKVIEELPASDNSTLSLPVAIEECRHHANPDPQNVLKQLQPLLARYKLALSPGRIVGAPCFGVPPSGGTAKRHSILMHIHRGPKRVEEARAV